MAPGEAVEPHLAWAGSGSTSEAAPPAESLTERIGQLDRVVKGGETAEACGAPATDYRGPSAVGLVDRDLLQITRQGVIDLLSKAMPRPDQDDAENIRKKLSQLKHILKNDVENSKQYPQLNLSFFEQGLFHRLYSILSDGIPPVHAAQDIQDGLDSVILLLGIVGSGTDPHIDMTAAINMALEVGVRWPDWGCNDTVFG